MKTEACVVCGATLTLKRFEMPYCKTQKCAIGYGPYLVKERTREEGDHLIWDGSFRKSGNPYFQVSYAWNGERHQVSLNPMLVLWEEHGNAKPDWGEVVSRTCDEPRCVGHIGLRLRRDPKPHAPTTPSKQSRLPAQPLLDYLEPRGGVEGMALMYPHLESVNMANKVPGRAVGGAPGLVVELGPESRRRYDNDRRMLLESQKRGWIDLYEADRICIDVLGLHPYFIYGELFYDTP
jgi:hypothetical protein